MAKAAAKKRTARSTGAQTAEPISCPPPADRESVNIRKISNGFIINRSGYKGGEYFDREEFSAAKPVVTIAGDKKERR